MKTVTSTKVVCEIDKLTLGWWNEEQDKFIPIESQDDYEKAAIALGCSEKMLDTLVTLIASIQATIGTDLRDIWKRLDKAGL